MRMSSDDHTYPPLHCEGDEGQVFKFRDVSVIQRGKGLLLSYVQDSDIKRGGGRLSAH